MANSKSRPTKGQRMMYYELLIGIDPGKNTGLAIWCSNGEGCFQSIQTVTQAEAQDIILKLYEGKNHVKCIIEDARQIKGYRSKTVAARMYGAGSVTRSCQMWEEFFRHHKIPWIPKSPIRRNSFKKITSKTFKQITGWKGRTSEHARDAAMLVYQQKLPMPPWKQQI